MHVTLSLTLLVWYSSWGTVAFRFCLIRKRNDVCAPPGYPRTLPLDAKSTGANEGRKRSRRKVETVQGPQVQQALDTLIVDQPSVLPPISGTAASKQAEYNSKDPRQRYLEELLAPAAPGQEPKIVQVAKTVTWVAVLVLVILEIVVSVKVGGMPFDFSKAKTTDIVKEVVQ